MSAPLIADVHTVARLISTPAHRFDSRGCATLPGPTASMGSLSRRYAIVGTALPVRGAYRLAATPTAAAIRYGITRAPITPVPTIEDEG